MSGPGHRGGGELQLRGGGGGEPCLPRQRRHRDGAPHPRRHSPPLPRPLPRHRALRGPRHPATGGELVGSILTHSIQFY